MRRLDSILPLAALAGIAASLAACGGQGRATRAPGVPPAEFAAWSPDPGAFDPMTLRVHPLTRITRDTDGTPILACHVELRDAANQVVKALGLVQVELFVSDAEGQPDAVGQSWEVDLREPRVNAAAFDDLVTRTYLLRLGSLPAAAARLADAPGTDEESPSYGVTVRFIFKTAGPGDPGAERRASEIRTLEATGTLTEP